MILAGFISTLIGSIALFGAIKENPLINITILIFLIVGVISDSLPITPIPAYSFYIQLTLIVMSGIYVALMEDESESKESQLIESDVESNCDNKLLYELFRREALDQKV
jgi:hypothetical protein